MNRQLGISSGIFVALVLMSVADWGARSVAAQEFETAQSAVPLPTQPAPTANQPEKRPVPELYDSNPNQGLASEALVNEINAIRTQLGGGIAQQLNGLNLGQPGVPLGAEQVFNQELDRLATQTLPPTGHPTSAPPASTSGPFAPRSRASDHQPSAVCLRQAARRLDEIAADLEDARLFQDADEIREQARKFWTQARQFDSRN